MCDHLKKRLKYAKKIIKYGLADSFYKLESYQTPEGVSTSYKLRKNSYVKLYKTPGYYTIYRRVNGKLECLYVGKSDQDMHQRINRWAKGIAGKLRHDEGHSAATKARRDGVKLSDELYIKFITMWEVNKIVDDEIIRQEPLDEWIAPLLKSKYNKRTFELGSSLEDFF